MPLHKDLILTDMHAMIAATYADAAARDADTPFQVAANVNKIVRTDSPVGYFMLLSVGPAVFTQFGADGGNLTGPGTLTDNELARFDGVTGQVLQGSVVTLDDAGVLSGLTGLDINGNRILAPNTVVVSVPADLPNTLVAGTHYRLDAPIIITAGNEITVPNEGNITISSSDRINNTLSYSGTTGTLFTAAALTGQFELLNILLLGNNNSTRLFNLTGAGFPQFTLQFAFANNWGDVGTFSTFGGGVTMATVNFTNNDDGIKMIDAVFLGITDCFFQNFSDTGTDFLTVDALTVRVSLDRTAFIAQPNERVLNLNSGFTGEMKISSLFGVLKDRLFRAGGLDQTSPFVDSKGSTNQPDSTTHAEANLNGNGATTLVPLAGAMVEIAIDTNWIGVEVESMSVATDGAVTLDALSTVQMKLDGNISIEPASGASISISVQTILLSPTPVVVTFTNATNIINETDTALVDGDLISFRDTAGTLPAEIRPDVVYHVVSQTTNTFQVAYTDGGAAIVFTDDGTPTNSYKAAEAHGSTSTNDISSSNPRDLIPQASAPVETNGKLFLVVLNNASAVDLLVGTGYIRLFE
ncbi:MAG: hypothetical protein V3S98_03340 [Dehalococcoidia bacterium]